MSRLTALPFDLQEAFLRMYGWECLLDLENEKYVVSLSGIWADKLLSCACASLLTHLPRGQTPAAQPGAHLALTSLGIKQPASSVLPGMVL